MAFKLKINLNKTKVMYQPVPESYDISQDIQLESQVLTQINTFKYLGSTVVNNNRLDAELDTQMSKASKAFGGLTK